MSTFSVKNFEKFQHYKDRSPPWIRLYNSLLDDYEFGRLPDAAKGHLLAIWLLASRYENQIPFDPEWVSRRINATEPVNLSALVDAGFILMDQPCNKMLAPRKQVAKPEREESRADTEQRESNARPRQIPLDWVPKDPNASPSEIGRFVKYNAARGTLMADWDAAWEVWVSRSADFAKPNGSAPPETPGKPVVWVDYEEPNWWKVAAKFKQERGIPLLATASKHGTGQGAFVPADWLPEARAH